MSSQTGSGPTVDRLISELRDGSRVRADADPAARSEAVFEDTSGAVYGDDPVSIDDGLVKQSLTELLVLLVTLRTSDTHGKEIMGDINRFFGTQLSPGTVYPTLHDLADEGLLEMRDLVQTKEYVVDDHEAARRLMEETMRQHLALGLLFRQTLEELEDDADAQ
jgi:DNA-binding PadR family transcriptional regulator